ncbi:hypothetical protein AX760_01935 [Pararhizobium antarcticum]|uniref:Uncharacterized protein n=1 Tax=Pararhizobium antarcticum TaxID=1798805 RepID=A0A657LWD6_9HYPH|nr:hypothetical protein AX761_14390 [Rhizobium sp. 58]OJF98802.1 hypothetical protein AX760_01880 [Pararhizobium antarcticum]OJF98811.1 hypothetical protein AX760_01935 [Pararhizobium antarcticum]
MSGGDCLFWRSALALLRKTRRPPRNVGFAACVASVFAESGKAHACRRWWIDGVLYLSTLR